MYVVLVILVTRQEQVMIVWVFYSKSQILFYIILQSSFHRIDTITTLLIQGKLMHHFNVRNVYSVIIVNS